MTQETAGSSRKTLTTPQLMLSALALALISCAVSIYTFSHNFEGGITYEFCQYSEIGRNILEGKGFRTAMVYPFVLAYLDEKGIPFDENHLAPVLDRFPLQSYLTAVSQVLAGHDDAPTAALSLLLLAACVALTFLVGYRFFSPIEGAVAALLFAFNPSFQRGFVLWGLPDFGFCLLTLLTTVMICRDESNIGYWIAAGAVAGLEWLARSNSMLWFPLFIILILLYSGEKPKTRSWMPAHSSRVMGFLAGLVVISSPGWIYSLRWFGAITPPTLPWDLGYHVVQNTFPALSYKTLTVSGIVVHHFPALMRKFQVCLTWYLRDFPTMWQMHIILPFAAYGLFQLIRLAVNRPFSTTHRWIALMTAMLVLQLLVFSAIRYETLGEYVSGRYFLWFAPAAFLLASHGAMELSRLAKAKHWGIVIFCAVNLAFFLHFLTPEKTSWAHPTELMVDKWPEIQAAAKAAGPQGLVVTNLPTQIAWYTRHRTIALPADPEDLIAVDHRHPISAILISRVNLGELANTPMWREMVLGDPDLKALHKFCSANGFAIAHEFGTAILLVRKR